MIEIIVVVHDLLTLDIQGATIPFLDLHAIVIQIQGLGHLLTMKKVTIILGQDLVPDLLRHRRHRHHLMKMEMEMTIKMEVIMEM